MGYNLNYIKAINKHLTETPKLKTINLETILETVAEVTGIQKSSIISKSRLRDYSDARSLYCHAARAFTNYSTTAIGYSINRDHSTVIHSTRKIDTLIKVDAQIRNQNEMIKSALHALSQNTTPTDIIMQRVVNKLITNNNNVTYLY